MPLLHAIAADGLAQRSPTPAVFEARSDRVPTPLHRPTTSSRPRSVRTAVLARSAGHCEVLAEGCRYTHDRLVSRLSVEETETSTPPGLFAACSACAVMVAALEPKLAARFGYVIDAHRDPAYVPFYWRRSRWVLLDGDGWLTEMPDHAATA
jgi:hypothetical protein